MFEVEKLLHILEDNKAEAIEVIPVQDVTTITDHMIICTARSKPHAKALADHVSTQMKQAGYPPLGIEGQETGEWILVDLGDAIVHIMLEETRQFYSLEKMWALSEATRANDNA